MSQNQQDPPEPATFQAVEMTAFKPTPTTAAPKVPKQHRALKALMLKPALLPIVAIALGLLLWFVWAFRYTELRVTPPEASLSLDSFLYLQLDDGVLIQAGHYQGHLSAVGYETLKINLDINKTNSSLTFKLSELPGEIMLISEPKGATVTAINNIAEPGQTPVIVKLPAGNQKLLVSLARYKTQAVEIAVIGRGEKQSIHVILQPNWADIEINSTPPGATVWSDNENLGTTPGVFPVIAGIRTLKIAHLGYKTFTTALSIEAQAKQTLPMINLILADSKVALISSPADASVLIDNAYIGQTPLTAELATNKKYRLILQKPGYKPHEQSLQTTPETAKIQITLQPIIGEIFIEVTPPGASVLIDGVIQGQGNRVLKLPYKEHRLTFRHAGYADYAITTTPKPGFPEKLSIKLLTLADAKLARLPGTYQNNIKQTFQLVQSGLVRMGSSRNELGFQRDQARRDVTLAKVFYLGTKEVSNAEYRLFEPGHSSGLSGRVDLNLDNHPVVRVSWLQAARYCNWRSTKEGLTKAYIIHKEGAVSFVPTADGYRLPTEAEWAWAARQPKKNPAALRFPWGNLTRPRHLVGNFGTPTATTFIPRSYKDGYLGTAPSGSFPANPLGIFDLAGNVAEWSHDYYHFQPKSSWAGPEAGNYRVIRGSSWLHAQQQELRMAYRRYGNAGTEDVGFRLARTPQ